MYGAEGRIGLLVPSVNTVAEPEIGKLLPEGVAVYAARMRNQRADTGDSKAMLQHVERAADELGSAHVDVLAFACTASSFVGGEAGEVELSRRMEAAGKAPAVTTSRAVREALQYLGARRIVVATPYVEELNRLEKAYLEADGAEVLAIAGMGIVEAFDIGMVTPEEAGQFALSAWTNGADVLFISCTNLRTIEALQPLAEELGKPVISSNSATCWASLRTLGISDEVAALALTGCRASELSI